MDNPLKRESVHGRLVNFNQSLKETAVRHLRFNLESREAKSLFDAARSSGEAQFEDRMNRNFTLVYNRGDGTYHLVEREHD